MRHYLVAVVSSRNETVPHGRLVARRHLRDRVSASVMHSNECPAYSYPNDYHSRTYDFNFQTAKLINSAESAASEVGILSVDGGIAL